MLEIVCILIFVFFMALVILMIVDMVKKTCI